MGLVPERDESCVCGSGRRFGSCCAGRFWPDLSAWLRAERAEERLARSVVEYSRRTWGRELFDEALSAFFMSRTSSQSVYSATPAFVRWCPFTWVPDWRDDLEHDACPIPERRPTASLGVTWLASASSRVSVFEETFVVTAARSPHTLLLVESVIPGWSLIVRDLLTGRRFRVVEPKMAAFAESLFRKWTEVFGLFSELNSGRFSCRCSWTSLAAPARNGHSKLVREHPVRPASPYIWRLRTKPRSVAAHPETTASLRFESRTPSQIHLAAPSSFTAVSCQFHFERAFGPREGVP